MALYINGRPVNPIASFLVSLAVLAAVIGLGVLLLPFIGGLLLFVLFCVAALALYGVYYRWRYGDPFRRMQEEALRQMRRRAAGENAEPEVPEANPQPRGRVRTGVRRTTTVDDVEIVEEIRRRDP